MSNMAAESPSDHRARSRASVACIKCRERKIKCNVQSMEPGEPCSLCKRVGTECVVKYDDHRKINTSKKRFKQLEGRLGTLEALMKSVRGPGLVDATDQGRAPSKSTSPSAVSSTETNRARAEPPTEPGPDTSTSTLNNERPVSDQMEVSGYPPYAAASTEPLSLHTPNDFDQLFLTNSQLEHFSPPMYSAAAETNMLVVPDVGLQGNAIGLPSEADMLHFRFCPRDDFFDRPSQLSGQTIFSHRPNIFNEKADNNYDINASGHARDTAPLEAATGRSQSFEESEAFRLKYLQMWWNFSEMSAHLVDPDLFMKGYRDGVRSHYFSTFALNALLACSIRLDKEETTRKLSSIFAERAKKMILGELDHPTMSTIHGLCLLGDWECTNGSENTGWIYVGTDAPRETLIGCMLTMLGIACRLIVDLGLHQDCTELVNAGSLRTGEFVARQRLVYGCYVYEGVWAVFLGRPSSIRASYLHLPRPSADRSEYQVHLLAAWVDLSTLMSKMVSIFDHFHLDVTKSPVKLCALDRAVHDWTKSLPADVRWTDQDQTSWPPSLCALYMQFCNLQILYHRTVTGNKQILEVLERDERNIWPYTPEMSRRIMHDNAVKIACALEFRRLAYEEWGFATLMLDIIFTATSTLIDCMVSSTDRSSALKDHKWLMCLLESCEGLKFHYPVVRRMLAVLDSLLESTGLAKFIWRGSMTASNASQSNATNSPATNSNPLHPNQSANRAVSFDPKRWCRD